MGSRRDLPEGGGTTPVRHHTSSVVEPRWTVRTLAALSVVAVLAAGCGVAVDADATAALPPATSSAPTPDALGAPPGVDDVDGIQEVLDRAAAAFRAGDPAAVEAVLHRPDSAFGQRWTDRARHMAELPLSHYALVLDTSLPDLSTERVRDQYEGRVQVVYVVEEHAYEGFDDAPAADDLFLTVVDEGDGWRISTDVDGEALGFVSVDHLWDHGPVTVSHADTVMAIHHPDGPAVATLVAEASEALRQAADRWPLEWPERVPIVVPRDEDELAELLHVTFDLSNFVAFATATPVGERGSYDLTGSRVVINPARFLDRPGETRERILVHELVHVASRPSAGPMVPSWLDEGVAQAIGERQSTTGTALLDATDRGARHLPTDGEFTVGGRDRIFLSYQLAWSFVEHLVEVHGADAVGRFYAAVGRGSVGEPGTEAFHVDRAAREVLGEPFDALVDGWRAS